MAAAAAAAAAVAAAAAAVAADFCLGWCVHGMSHFIIIDLKGVGFQCWPYDAYVVDTWIVLKVAQAAKGYPPNLDKDQGIARGILADKAQETPAPQGVLRPKLKAL